MHIKQVTLIQCGFVVCLFAGCLTVLVLQHKRLSEPRLSNLDSEIGMLRYETREVERLRRENEEVARLRIENQEIQRLRRDNADLYRLRNESHLFKEQKEELERLRSENGQFRAELKRKADLLSKTPGHENTGPKAVEALPLYTRFYKVDPKAFYEAVRYSSLQSRPDVATPIPDFFTDGLANPNPYGNRGSLNFVTRQSEVEIVQAPVHAFFAAIGVDLSPPKNLFFKDRQGMLMVRATLQDLNTVEQALANLKPVFPQQP